MLYIIIRRGIWWVGQIADHFYKWNLFLSPILATRGLGQFVELMSSLRDTIGPNYVVFPKVVVVPNVYNNVDRGQKTWARLMEAKESVSSLKGGVMADFCPSVLLGKLPLFFATDCKLFLDLDRKTKPMNDKSRCTLPLFWIQLDMDVQGFSFSLKTLL